MWGIPRVYSRVVPTGRPSLIDAVVGCDDEGNAITVADRIVAALCAGNYFEQATAAAGIHKETAYGWLRLAAQIQIRAKGRTLEDLQLSDHERRCVEFSDAVVRAEARWEASALDTLEQLGRGGVTATHETLKYDAAGNLIERTVRTETLPPNAQVIEWRLTRRFPQRYGQHVEVVDGGALLTDDETTSALVESLSAYLEGVDKGDETGRRKRAPKHDRGA
jgi:hypothetical protein